LILSRKVSLPEIGRKTTMKIAPESSPVRPEPLHHPSQTIPARLLAAIQQTSMTIRVKMRPAYPFCVIRRWRACASHRKAATINPAKEKPKKAFSY
jgi:hypothetical protein